MTVIDERGRLFGRLNFIDAIVVLIVVAMIGFVAVGYSLFRLPRAPVVDTLEPATLAEMTATRVRLKGHNFLPYLRVFLSRTDGKDFVKRYGENAAHDGFTIANASQVTFLLETPEFAELDVPALKSGTYDILFFDDTQFVLEKKAALTVTPAVAPRVEPPAVSSPRP